MSATTTADVWYDVAVQLLDERNSSHGIAGVQKKLDQFLEGDKYVLCEEFNLPKDDVIDVMRACLDAAELPYLLVGLLACLD